MTVIAPVIISMSESTFKVGLDNYEQSVSSAKFVPTTPIASFTGIGGTTTSAAGAPTWVLTLTFAQDWLTANSLSNYLMDNKGTTKVVQLAPVGGGTAFDATVLIVASDIGGDANSLATASVTLTVIGAPSLAG
ncbi:MAG TPA: hypothetical protein VFU07_09670 [Candidatus Lumbricidophila sp.]|nr:hypothetical protein [Candidatus Lumbricidophila sp.]